MKNVNITGFHQVLGEGDHKKTINMGNCLQRRAWRICTGAWQKIGRRVFLKKGRLIPHAHYDLILVHAGT